MFLLSSFCGPERKRIKGKGERIVVWIVLCALTYGIFIGTSKVSESCAFSKNAIAAITEKVFSWQIRHFTQPQRYLKDWQHATFYAGVMAAYRATENPIYLQEVLRWGEKNRWEPGPDPQDANDQCCGQTYLELYFIKRDSRMLIGIRSTFDTLIKNPHRGRELWGWCDALFMAPPALARLGEATNETKYYELLHGMWWDATKLLFDEQEGLFYRDRGVFRQRTKNGKKVFWARGNGWVMGGIARVLEYIPEEDPWRTKYIGLFKRMARAVINAQGKDGLWRTSLKDPDEFPQPETSSSSLFCFALAWGINQGILDRATFLPTVKRAWKRLYKAVDENGKLYWVQRPSDRPGPVAKNSTTEYGAGAFLLAASEVIKLKENNTTRIKTRPFALSSISY